MADIPIKPNQLFALFNWFLNNRHMEIELETPWVDKSVLSLTFIKNKPLGSINLNFSKSTFTNVDSNETLSVPEVIHAIVASGSMKPSGWRRAIHEILQESKKDYFRGERPCAIAFDTNALIGRCYTLIERELASRLGGTENIRSGYIMTHGVSEELSTYEKKYKKKDIDRLKSDSPSHWFEYNDFRNQLVGKSRMFRLGSVEALKMMSGGRCITIDSGRGDQKIIRALSRYQKEQNLGVYSLSGDSDFISMCHLQGIQGSRFDLPGFAKRIHNVRWRELADLIYTMSIRLGAIRLSWAPNRHCTIKGIWAGKKAEMWDSETITASSNEPALEKWLWHLLNVGYGK